MVFKAGLIAVIALFGVFVSTSTYAQDVNVYGSLEDVADVVVSPSGDKIAMLRSLDGVRAVFIYDLENPDAEPRVIPSPDKMKIRAIDWASDNYFIFKVSFTNNITISLGNLPFEIRRMFSYNLQTGESKMLLQERQFNWYIYLDDIDYYAPDDLDHVYVWAGGDLQKVNLKTGYSKPMNWDESWLESKFESWLMDEYGNQYAGAIFKEKRFGYEKTTRASGETLREYAGTFDVHMKRDGEWAKIYSQPDTVLVRERDGDADPKRAVPYSLIAVHPDDERKLVLRARNKEEFTRLYVLEPGAGAIDEVLFENTEYESTGIMKNRDTDELLAISYTEHLPKRVYFRRDFKTWQAELEAVFPEDDVYISHWSDDFRKIVVFISGPRNPGSWHLLDTESFDLLNLGSRYPDIEPKYMGNTQYYEYKARDGLTIPAYLTLPPGKTMGDGPFPLVLRPHGGPELRSDARFKYDIQYLAANGYAVLQPNYRGSDGYGAAFRDAGYGEFGGAMIDDIVDGGKSLVEDGIAENGKICAAGISYGGYAALAIELREPGFLACSISVNGVTDIGRIVTTDGRYDYWEDYMGSRFGSQHSDWSPGDNYKKMNVPMLLMHGENDSVVLFEQTSTFVSGLKRNKMSNYTFVPLKGDDHHLSSAKTRKTYLMEMKKFLDEHLK